MKNEVRKVLITYQSVDLVDLISLKKLSFIFRHIRIWMELEFILHLTVWWCDVSKKTSAVLVSRVKINCILHLNVNEALWRPLQAEENLFIIVAFIHTDKKVFKCCCEYSKDYFCYTTLFENDPNCLIWTFCPFKIAMSGNTAFNHKSQNWPRFLKVSQIVSFELFYLGIFYHFLSY